MEVNTSSTIDNENMYDYINGITKNPTIFIVLIVVTLGYIIYFFALGNKPNDSGQSITETTPSDSSISSNLMIAIVIGILILLVFIIP